MGLVWDQFGKVFLGVFQGHNDVGTCLGCVFGMCLGHVYDIFPLLWNIPFFGGLETLPKYEGMEHVKMCL